MNKSAHCRRFKRGEKNHRYPRRLYDLGKEAKLPGEVSQRAKDHILDTLAAIVSSSQLKPGRLAIQFAHDKGGKAECSVLGANVRTTASTAALANGMCAHADETDVGNFVGW